MADIPDIHINVASGYIGQLSVVELWCWSCCWGLLFSVASFEMRVGVFKATKINNKWSTDHSLSVAALSAVECYVKDSYSTSSSAIFNSWRVQVSVIPSDRWHFWPQARQQNYFASCLIWYLAIYLAEIKHWSWPDPRTMHNQLDMEQHINPGTYSLLHLKYSCSPSLLKLSEIAYCFDAVKWITDCLVRWGSVCSKGGWFMELTIWYHVISEIISRCACLLPIISGSGNADPFEVLLFSCC